MFMFKYKTKIKTLAAELSRTKKQLCKAKQDLKVEAEYAKSCWDSYCECVAKNLELEKEINELKKANKKLEFDLQVCKAVEEARKNCNCNKKEA